MTRFYPEGATWTHPSGAVYKVIRLKNNLFDWELVPPKGTPPPMAAVKLTWTDNSTNEANFNVERKDAPIADTTKPFVQINLTAPNVTQYTDSTVAEGGTYSYRVAASNSAGKSGYSNLVEIAVPFAIPTAPSALVAVLV